MYTEHGPQQAGQAAGQSLGSAEFPARMRAGGVGNNLQGRCGIWHTSDAPDMVLSKLSRLQGRAKQGKAFVFVLNSLLEPLC